MLRVLGPYVPPVFSASLQLHLSRLIHLVDVRIKTYKALRMLKSMTCLMAIFAGQVFHAQ